jgi:hypothetical protein
MEFSAESDFPQKKNNVRKIGPRLSSKFSHFRPERGLKAFVPQACQVIDTLIKDGAGKAVKTDEELKFNILVLAEVRFFTSLNLKRTAKISC